MSEGRERHQEQNFEVLRNNALKQATDDLLSKIPPKQQRLLDTLSTNSGVMPGTQVLGKLVDGKGVVQFQAGGLVCGTVGPEMIRELGLRLGSCFFEVVSDEASVLTLRVCSVDRASVQPAPEDDSVT